LRFDELAFGPRLFVGNEANPVAHCPDLRWPLESMIDDPSGTIQKPSNFTVSETDSFQSKINLLILMHARARTHTHTHAIYMKSMNWVYRNDNKYFKQWMNISSMNSCRV